MKIFQKLPKIKLHYFETIYNITKMNNIVK